MNEGNVKVSYRFGSIAGELYKIGLTVEIVLKEIKLNLQYVDFPEQNETALGEQIVL